ncbi:MAG: restriction endonuclease [Candidatus Wallbacteria bacterium]
MAIWLFRAGRTGEYENKFIEDGKIYLTWDQLNVNLKNFKEKIDLYNYLNENYPAEKPGRNRNWVGQIWPIAHDIKKEDWIILPSKINSSIHIGEVTSEYIYNKKAEEPFYHSMNVKWFKLDVPRSNFDQDLLYSFGAFMTVCRITRNDAENRIRKMEKNNWKSSQTFAINKAEKFLGEESENIDLEQYAIDSIAKFIIQKFKGHRMTELIEAMLIAQGYSTHKSPEGPDKGVDILAAPGPLGFGHPRICVQVKTQDNPIERIVLDQLIGTMQNFSAEQGLLISWSGFKNSFNKEIPAQFFKVRLWDQKDIVRELFNVYDKLDEDIKSEIPLKKIWTLTKIEE